MASSEIPEPPDMMVRFMRSGEVFTPSATIDNQALFAGRVNQLNRIIGAVSQRGQHAILFGERGVGKTSLANVLLKRLDRVNQTTIPFTCFSWRYKRKINVEMLHQLQPQLR
jgi:predicted AAA+ superfamily ATPase